jgi:hypothetical protein
VNEVPLEETGPARKAFGDLTERERDLVREALVAISRDPAVGREIPGRRPPSVEYTNTTALARDSAEAITVVYTHTPGMGVTVVYYVPDPQMVD